MGISEYRRVLPIVDRKRFEQLATQWFELPLIEDLDEASQDRVGRFCDPQGELKEALDKQELIVEQLMEENRHKEALAYLAHSQTDLSTEFRDDSAVITDIYSLLTRGQVYGHLATCGELATLLPRDPLRKRAFYLAGADFFSADLLLGCASEDAAFNLYACFESTGEDGYLNDIRTKFPGLAMERYEVLGNPYPTSFSSDALVTTQSPTYDIAAIAQRLYHSPSQINPSPH